MAGLNSYAWALTTQNTALNFLQNTNTIIPRVNWVNVTSSDSVQSTILNNAIMNTAGVITFPKTGTFVVQLVLDPKELLYTGAVLASLAQTTTNQSGQVSSFNIGTATLLSGSSNSLLFAQTIFCNLGDTLTLTLNFATSYVLPSAMRCVNTCFYLTDTSNDTRPIFIAGGNGLPVPSLPGSGILAPRFYVATQTLSSSNGRTTFNLTTNGSTPVTNVNNLLFPNGIGYISFSAKPAASVSNLNLTPIANEDSRAADNSSVTANVVVGSSTTVVLGGTVNSLQGAPNGTIVQCFVLGW